MPIFHPACLFSPARLLILGNFPPCSLIKSCSSIGYLRVLTYLYNTMLVASRKSFSPDLKLIYRNYLCGNLAHRLICQLSHGFQSTMPFPSKICQHKEHFGATFGMIYLASATIVLCSFPVVWKRRRRIWEFPQDSSVSTILMAGNSDMNSANFISEFSAKPFEIPFLS